MELLKTLMQHGYVIFKTDVVFLVQKISTPTEEDTCLEMYEDIPNGSFPSSTKSFETYDDALNFCKKRIKWEDPQEEPDKINWTVTLRYTHTGCGIQLRELGEITDADYDSAKKMSEKMAASYMVDLDDEIDYIEDDWEVKILPKR